MGQEIERKFLVSGAFRDPAFAGTRITQGYLSSVPERTVRVRIAGDAGFLTIKGASDASGVRRFEWEQAIALADAEQLLALCERGVIDKVRYRIVVGAHTYEVDEFLGENAGLVVAEIELAAADEDFEKPSWLGVEVTGDARYYNAALSTHPFRSW